VAVANASDDVSPSDVTITSISNATKKTAHRKTTGTVVAFVIQVLSTGGADSSEALALGTSIQNALAASVNSTDSSSFASVFNAQMQQEAPGTTIFISSSDLVITVTVEVNEVGVVHPSRSPAPTPDAAPAPSPSGTGTGSTDDDSSSDGDSTAAIAGGVAGGCALLVGVASVIFCKRKERNVKTGDKADKHMEDIEL